MYIYPPCTTSEAYMFYTIDHYDPADDETNYVTFCSHFFATAAKRYFFYKKFQK